MKAGLDYVGVTTPFYCNDGKGKYLLHKRSKDCRDEQGRWDPGSGKLEFGLTPEENVLKEVKEEYGCKGVIQKRVPAHSIHRTYKGKETHWITIPFFVLVDPRKVRNNDPQKIDKIDWFKLTNLPKPLHTGFKYTLKRYEKHFK